MNPLFVAVLLFLSSGSVIADNHLVETRYCGEPQRNPDGSIKRSKAVLNAFRKIHPLPADKNPAEWQIDHVIPLAEGGCDAVPNLQWLPKSIKTCADDDCKDRWERKGIYFNDGHDK